MKNQIIKQFNNAARSYDSERASLIPCFDDFYRIIIDLAETKNSCPRILDIGAGTGLLTRFLLLKYPDAEYTLIDISDEMLGEAQKRFQGNKKIKYINHDYAEYVFTEKYDIAVSSLSIHHLAHEEKQKLYQRVYTTLADDGVFINGDLFLSGSDAVEKMIIQKWISYIESSVLTEEKKKAAYSRMKMDKSASVQENIMWLEKAGFDDVDLLYKYYNFGILYGKRKVYS